MKKLFFAAAIIIAAFATNANAMVKHHTLPVYYSDTIKPKVKRDTITPKLKRDTITPKLKKDTITPVIVKHATVAMSDKQLNHILNLMRQKSNDKQKIRVLKLGIKNKGLKLDQLTKLLNQFLNDSSKLSIAEYAYPNTVDYEGYGAIDNLFAAQDSKDKLDDFLKHNK